MAAANPDHPTSATGTGGAADPESLTDIIGKFTARAKAPMRESPVAYRLTAEDGTHSYVGMAADADAAAQMFDVRVEPLYAEPVELSQAIRDILAERQRQIAKGYDAEHDDAHDRGELAKAASSYAYHATVYSPFGHLNYGPSPSWPFERDAWRPESPRADRIKSASMLIADVERMDRLAQNAATSNVRCK